MSVSFEEIRQKNQVLAEKLLGLISPEPVLVKAAASHPSLQDADAIVAHIEINDQHGVGVLLRRLFGDSSNIISLRSKDYYEGRQDFGAMHACISYDKATKDAAMWRVLELLGGATVRRILAVPYFPEDARNAIALKEAFGAPLCTFLMDDQNLYSDGIPDAVMAELLKKSSLRLAISPEMCAAYQEKYGYKIWFMPPVAPNRLIPTQLVRLAEQELRNREPLILGNIWGQHWLERLRSSLRGTNIRLRWHNSGEFRWLPCSQEELIQDGIVPQTVAEPDDRLVEILRQAPFLVLPSGTLDEQDDRKFIAQLSFPSRIPFILATSHAPILVLGNPDTAAARIVTRLGIGMVAPYGRESFMEAVAQITRPEVNLAMRRKAFLHSVRFADLGAAEWIWDSLEKGGPADSRYEEMGALR